MKTINLKGRNFITLLDYTPCEISHLLKFAAHLKVERADKNDKKYLKDKTIVIIFEKTSTRTRCSFEIGAYQQGATVTYISGGSQMGKKESVRDTALVLSRWYDGIEFRGYKHSDVEQLAQYSTSPVWNGLTDQFHPTQILADFLTIKEKLGENLKGKKLVFYGDTNNNMGVSLMIGAAKMGLHFVGCGPEKNVPKKELVDQCNQIAETTGAKIEFSTEPLEAAKNADVIYTDVWISMGDPEDGWTERIKTCQKFKVTKKIMKQAKETAIFMHCLPSLYNYETKIANLIFQKTNLECFEVEKEVFESSQSVVFDQAENRMHTIKAVMVATIADIQI